MKLTKTNSKDKTLFAGLHFCTGHTGKMENVWSLSSSPILNPICQARSKNPDLICHYCYSIDMQNQYKALNACNIRNTEILTAGVIDPVLLPEIDRQIFRLESFGDVQNENQIINYINLAAKNPRTIFAVWTKNPGLYSKVFNSGIQKPENLIIILSSCFLNHEAKPKFCFIDKVFTVYSKDYLKTHDVSINCGARNCDSCRRCYKKTTEIEFIREVVK